MLQIIAQKTVHFLPFLISILIAYSFLLNQARNFPITKNEVSWYFHTESFSQLFIRQDLKYEYWNGFLAFDHPPITKYIFGLALYLDDSHYRDKIEQLEKKYGRWDFMLNKKLIINTEEFKYEIVFLREVNLLFAIGIFIELYFLIGIFIKYELLKAPLPIFLAISPTFFLSIIHAQPDTQYIFFSLLAVICYLKWRNRSVIFLLLFAVCMGLSIAVKLTGLLLMISYCFFAIIMSLQRRKDILMRVKEVFLVMLVSFITWASLNPTIYYHPISNSIKYVTIRIDEEKSLEKFMPEAVVSPQNKFPILICRLFNFHCQSTKNGIASLLIFVMKVFLLSTGVHYLVIKLIRSHSREHVFVLSYILIFVLSLVPITLNYVQYFLPASIFLPFLQLIGLYGILKNLHYSRLPMTG